MTEASALSSTASVRAASQCPVRRQSSSDSSIEEHERTVVAVGLAADRLGGRGRSGLGENGGDKAHEGDSESGLHLDLSWSNE